MADYQYVGEELDLFALVANWKAYYGAHVSGYIRGDVLEVGAGFGATTSVLCDGAQSSWMSVEPDPDLAARLSKSAESGAFPIRPIVRVGHLQDLPPELAFDCILYIDVLEHIEDDRAELVEASRRLRSNGKLVILCPAHQFLFSQFDQAIGHFRRYNKRMIRAIVPEDLVLTRLFYLDAAGLTLSLGNRLLLRRSAPTARQIRLWDKLFVPLSRVIDPLLGYKLGKTVIGVWTYRPKRN